MLKEVVLGIGAGIIIFLSIIGVNIVPFILLIALAGGLYYFNSQTGGLKLESLKGPNRKEKQIGFSDIGGQNTAIRELSEALQFMIQSDELDQMGIRPLKGILLVGPPGTGKTLMARAAANFTQASFIAVSGSEFIEIYAGVGAKRVRQLFSNAKKKAQREHHHSAIIFIDELEILGGKRGSHSSHLEYDQTLNQLLVEMDGIKQNEYPRILLIGATNRIDILDEALLRPGRFDRQVAVGLPDKEGRKKILEIHNRNKPLADDFDLEEIARATFGFSGAHLESLTNEAAILAKRENLKCIEQRHYIEAIDKVMMGEKLEKSPLITEKERISIHESGHALISEHLEKGSVAYITIIPRGRAMGFMRKSIQDERYLYTREDIEKQIMIALGGAVAETIKYSNRSTGAGSDFQQAWDLAREIVKNGLSSLGIVQTEDIPQEILYNECRQIITALEKETEKILLTHKELLFKLAERLLETESFERKQFIEFINEEQKTA